MDYSTNKENPELVPSAIRIGYFLLFDAISYQPFTISSSIS